MPRDGFFTALAKAPRLSCVIVALDHMCPAPSARLPVLLKGVLADGTGPPRRHGLATHETRRGVRSSSSRFTLREL